MTQTEEKTFQKWSPPSPEAFRIASDTVAAKYLRAGLKIELGLSSKDCSVRCSGGSIHLDLKNTPRANRAPLSTVEKIAELAEHIRRDEMTGDILAGGNRFVHANRHTESTLKMGEPFRKVLGEARDKLSKSADQSLGIPFEAAGVEFVYWGPASSNYGQPSVSNGQESRLSFNPDMLAGYVAEMLLEAGKLPLAPCEIIETNNKRGPFFLLVPSWQLGPELFAACKDEAKSRGGWYSRAWGSTPGGFGFDSRQSAKSFGLWLDSRGQELGD